VVKRVKLITGLQIEEVVAYDIHCIYVEDRYNHSFSSPDRNMLTTTERKVHVVPIKHWVENWVTLNTERDNWTEEGYIAASPEIDEVLGKYLRCCHNEITYLKEHGAKREGQLFHLQNKLDCSLRQITKYETLTFWQRLKFLFKGNIY
jgi:hypothetical protein